MTHVLLLCKYYIIVCYCAFWSSSSSWHQELLLITLGMFLQRILKKITSYAHFCHCTVNTCHYFARQMGLFGKKEKAFFLIWPHMPDWYLCLLILSVEWIGLRSTEEITKVHFWVSVRVIAETELPWYWTVPVISCGSDRITRRKEKLSAHSLPLCILEVWCELLSLPWQNETAETMRQRTLSPLNLFMSGFLSHRQEN